MSVLINSRADLTLEHFRRVTLEGEGVTIGSAARQAMAAAARSFAKLVEAATEGSAVHEWGAASEDGAGPGIAALPERVVRGIVFARLADLVEGHAACRPEAAELLAGLLDGQLPAIPVDCPMAAAEPAALGRVVRLLPAGVLGERERRALLLGSPCATALAADAAISAQHRLRLAVAVFALSAEALNAPLDAYHPALRGMWGDRFIASVVDLLSGWLAGAAAGRRPYQAPVSFRVLPQVLGQAARAVAGMAEVARVSLSSVTVDPVYLPPSGADSPGVVLRAGGAHNAIAYPALDALSAAWADLCTLADRHTAKLLREDPSLGARSLGLVQAGIGEQARHAAARTLLPPSEAGTVDGQDDVSAPVFFAYSKHLAATAALDRALAALAIVASQELGLAGREPAEALRPLARLAGPLAAADQHGPDQSPDRPGQTPHRPDQTPHRPGQTPDRPDQSPDRPGQNPHRPDHNRHGPGDRIERVAAALLAVTGSGYLPTREVVR